MSNLSIRPANIADAAVMHRFILELALYEKAENEVLATVADIEKSIFSAQTTTHALICQVDNQPIGLPYIFLIILHGLDAMACFLKTCMFRLSLEALVRAKPC